MEVKSTYKFARVSAKKARDVARAIQGLPVSAALDTLNFTPKKSAELIGKTLKSAVANAENNHDLDADDLIVKKAAPAKEVAPAASGDRGRVYETAPDTVDDLKKISGVGPALEEKLNGFGIYTFAQIAEWSQENINTFDDLLSFKGRIERDNWIDQAKEFSAS